MTQTSRIGVLVDVTKRGTGTQDAIRDLQQLDNAAKTLSDGLKGLAVAGGVAGTIQLGSAALDLARTAAQAERTRTAFDNLAAGAGQSGDAMLAAMQKASRGAISNSDLVLAANRAMLLGVADSGRELSQLLEVARVRGEAMGLTVSQAFDDLVTGLGRMSPLILDNLGIVTGGEQVFVDYAASIGTTSDKLTDVEKKQALFNKVVSESAPLVEAAADASTSAAEKFEKFDAAVKNLRESLGSLIAGSGAADAMNSLAGQLAVIEEFGAKAPLVLWRAALEEIGISTGMSAEELERLHRVMGVYIDAVGDATGATDSLGGALGRVMVEANNASGATETLVRGGGQLSDVLRDGAAASNELRGVLAESPATFAIFAAAAQAAGVEVSELISLMDAASAQLSQLQGAREAAVGGLARQLASLSERGLVDPDQATELFQTGVEKVDRQVQVLSEELARGRLTADEFAFQMAFVGQTADDQADAIEEADRAAKAYSRTLSSDAKKAATEAERAFSNLTSKVQGVLSSALDTGTGVDPDELLEKMGLREDAINENARRLADIAVNGFKDQDWLGEFEREAPDIFKALQEAGDPQAAAARMLKDFQDGLLLDGLIDKDKAKDLVRRMLVGEQNLAQMAKEIATELSQEFGNVAPQDIAALTSRVLGTGGAPSADGEDGASVGSEFASGLTSGIGTAGTQAIQALNEQLRNKDNLALVKAAGEENGRVFGEGFGIFVDSIPERVLNALAGLVAPLVQAAQQQQASLTQAR